MVSLSKNYKTKQLHPFVDNFGILKVVGRLGHSNLVYDKKYLIMSPNNCKLTNMILSYYHKKYLHCGPQCLLFYVHNKFCLLNGHNNCMKILYECIICFKCQAKAWQQLMGDLPFERINENFTFKYVGVDFCNPFIRYKNQHKEVFQKVYVCIFVCIVTKTIHLELD